MTPRVWVMAVTTPDSKEIYTSLHPTEEDAVASFAERFEPEGWYAGDNLLDIHSLWGYTVDIDLYNIPEGPWNPPAASEDE